ncbi:MAG: MFS transporter [Desulfobacterales bacterium]|nr:MFS transporter [Desulfobacterales bacterium]
MLSNRILLSTHYFLYFGIMGVTLPYFNLYCYKLGFSGYEIGLLSAVKTMVSVVFGLFWGGIADFLGIRKQLYIFCSFMGLLLFFFYLFVTDFKLVLLISVVYTMFYAPVIAFLEAFTMDCLDNKKVYGKIRLWGSISFIIISIIIGKLIDLYSVKIILFAVLIGSLLQSLFSFSVPYVSHAKMENESKKLDWLLKPKLLIFLFCAFLMLVSHSTYYGYYSIYLENIGFDKTFIGITWAVAVMSEIIVMMKSDYIFKKFSLEIVLIFSFIAASARWVIIGFSDNFLFLIIAQVFHAFTYGSFHMASIIYIDRESSKNAKTIGQVINNGVTYGFGMMIGFLINGFFYEYVKISNLFFLSSFLAFIAFIVFGVSYIFFRDKKFIKNT